MKRHFVSASGMVKIIRTTPLESEVNCGKKNAVSFRFLRAATLLKSGFGAAGCRLAPPPPADSFLSDKASTPSRSTAAPAANAAPGIGPARSEERRVGEECR